MKILYGVQGTGNGHLTRARAMSKQLRTLGVGVDYVFSGRQAEKYFSMGDFGNWKCLDGLTFVIVKGKVKPIQTIFNAKPIQLLRDIRSLPVEDYDLVISDFEPVSAWAARRKNIRCLGLGHQYAFDFPIPKKGDNILTRYIMRKFAPTNISVGLHWYHFQQPILPPIVETWRESVETQKNAMVVYLPFENPSDIIALFRNFENFTFSYYGDFGEKKIIDNIQLNPISKENFQIDLAKSNGVISNAGFELASEAISLGKKLLVKPLHGQMEQTSNAFALEKLELGIAANKLSARLVDKWLMEFEGRKVEYPNVAQEIAKWIVSGELDKKDDLIEKLWTETDSGNLKTFQPYQKQS
ncbi:MJ1255/VC2487 family glycosyltransferase [Aurantivibrio infirmus]